MIDKSRDLAQRKHGEKKGGQENQRRLWIYTSSSRVVLVSSLPAATTAGGPAAQPAGKMMVSPAFMARIVPMKPVKNWRVGSRGGGRKATVREKRQEARTKRSCEEEGRALVGGKASSGRSQGHLVEAVTVPGADGQGNHRIRGQGEGGGSTFYSQLYHVAKPVQL